MPQRFLTFLKVFVYSIKCTLFLPEFRKKFYTFPIVTPGFSFQDSVLYSGKRKVWSVVLMALDFIVF